MDETTRVLEIRHGSITIGADISLRSSFFTHIAIYNVR